LLNHQFNTEDKQPDETEDDNTVTSRSSTLSCVGWSGAYEPAIRRGRGDAAGLSAASKCKREDSEREVIVYEKSEWISYAHCGMPYYIKGEVDSLGDLLSLSPREVDERGIGLHRNHEGLSVDPEEQLARVHGPDGEPGFTGQMASQGSRARWRIRTVLRRPSHRNGRTSLCGPHRGH
jgi:hypothetical protein